MRNTQFEDIFLINHLIFLYKFLEEGKTGGKAGKGHSYQAIYQKEYNKLIPIKLKERKKGKHKKSFYVRYFLKYIFA